MRMYWESIDKDTWDNMKEIRGGLTPINPLPISPIIYFDMDGTLAKFNKNAPMEEVFSPDYFRNLEPQREMVWLAKKLYDQGFDVRILSKSCYSAIQEKYEWLQEHMPFIEKQNIYFVPLDADKNNFVPAVKPVDVLIDDYWKNLTPDKWHGTAIKCVTDINTKDLTLPWVELKASPTQNLRMVTWAMLRSFAAELEVFKMGQVDVYTYNYIKAHSGLTEDDFYSMCGGFGIDPVAFCDYGMKNIKAMPCYLDTYKDFDTYCALLNGKMEREYQGENPDIDEEMEER